MQILNLCIAEEIKLYFTARDLIFSHKLQGSGPFENHSHLRFPLEERIRNAHFQYSSVTHESWLLQHTTQDFIFQRYFGPFWAVLKHHSLIDWKSGSFEKQPTTKVKVRNQQPTRINQHHHCSNRYSFFGERNLAPLSRDLIQLLERSSQEVDPLVSWECHCCWR